MTITRDDARAIGRLDAHDQAALVRRGALSPLELAEAAILRIEACDPALNGVSGRGFAHARAAAARVDRAAPMAAVPYLLKASLAYPGWPQTSGSRARARAVATAGYPIVERFDAAGLVPVAMSTMPEFGLLVSGEALLEGPTRNPWDDRLSPGGSSTGAAVAVAAGLVPLAHASDAAGSIRVPASHCGVVGFKPGRGMNVRARAAHLLDDLLCSDALIARSVRDAAWGARWCRPRDSAAAPAPARRLRIALDPDGLAGAPDAAVAAVVERGAAILAGLGHDVIPAAPALDRERTAAALETLWSYLGGDVADGVAAANPDVPIDTLLEPWTLALAARRATIAPQALADAYAAIADAGRTLAAFHERYDVLLSPVTRTPPPPLGTLAPTLPYATLAAAFFDHASYTPIQNMTGQPSIALPLVPGTPPLGVMLSAACGGDDLLLDLAADAERAAPWGDRWPPVNAVGVEAAA